jgi:hypothetical protein
MAALMLPTGGLLAEPAPILTKPIPGAGDELPAITCAIPATTRVEHMTENMQAGCGPMPSAEPRQRMVRFIESL